MKLLAVVLVDDYPQPPARQRPVAQALYDIEGSVAREYVGRPAAVRGLAGTQLCGHIDESVKE